MRFSLREEGPQEPHRLSPGRIFDPPMARCGTRDLRGRRGRHQTPALRRLVAPGSPPPERLPSFRSNRSQFTYGMVLLVVTHHAASRPSLRRRGRRYRWTPLSVDAAIGGRRYRWTPLSVDAGWMPLSVDAAIGGFLHAPRWVGCVTQSPQSHNRHPLRLAKNEDHALKAHHLAAPNARRTQPRSQIWPASLSKRGLQAWAMATLVAGPVTESRHSPNASTMVAARRFGITV